MTYLRRPVSVASLALSLAVSGLTAHAASVTHGPTVKDLNTPRVFPKIESRSQWQARAQEIREQILVSCGLWPLPEKRAVHAHVFGRVERDGYSIEKVYLETYPGFYLAGNLYRPLGRGKGPFPGILNPHGHWANGRMADTKDGSIAARCISFARQGMVAFSYDMVGYNDTRFPDAATNRALYETHRTFGTNSADQLWSISLMGLQTWNSVRALDFVASLPDVDKQRLACTGESGGGTQTFMLGAVDDRLAVQAPIVMVSHTMQGGCSCENAPGLRVEYSNMEIAAVPAPRPQILVAATGDWTTNTMEVEGPAIESVYRQFGAADRLRYVRFDFGHNYNQTSREAVYAWFGQWLLRHADPASLKEQPYYKEPDADLRVFPDGKLPEDALPKEPFIESLKQAHRAQWQKGLPRNKRGLEAFKRETWPEWKHTLQIPWPPDARQYSKEESRSVLSELGLTLPQTEKFKDTVVIVVRSAAGDNPGESSTKAEGTLLRPDMTILTAPPVSESPQRDEFANFFTTYNRTYLQEQTRRLVSACVAVRELSSAKRVILLGHGRAGLWALLAAPAADAVIADCGALDVANDETLLATGLFCPGLRNLGTFEGAPMLAAPHPLLLHNTGNNFPTDGIRSTYRAARAGKQLRIETAPLPEDALLDWASKL